MSPPKDADGGPGRTFALLIGISRYAHFLELVAPANDAAALAESLLDAKGSALPESQVVLLTDRDATQAAVITALKRIASLASESDRIFIYFAGHGEKLTDDFGLMVWESARESLEASSLSGRLIGKTLAPTRARGVLMVIDCCYGANFADRAPDFFKASIKHGYRVLLSSTRADEKSWEIEEGGGTLFSKYLRTAIDGSRPVGAVAGAIFLSDLARFIANNVEADLRKIDPTYHQEPTFWGVYGRDPLLFLQARLTQRRVLLLLARYSVRDLSRFLLTGVVGAALLLSAIMAAHYSILERSQYAVVATDRIELREGRHGFNAYGFPETLWVTDFTTEDVGAESPLRNEGGAINAPIEAPVGPVLREALNPSARIRLAYWAGDLAGARDGLKQLWVNDKGLYGVLGLLPEVMGAEDLPWLAEVASQSTSIDARASAMVAAASLEPGHAASGFQSPKREPYTLPMELLSATSPPCDDIKKAYIVGLLGEGPAEDYRASALSAALRLDCQLTVPDLANVLIYSFGLFAIEDIAGYVDVDPTGEQLLTLLPTFALADPAESELPRKSMLVIARSKRAGCYPEIQKQLQSSDTNIQLAAAAALLAHCPPEIAQQVRAAVTLSAEMIAVLAMHGAVSVAEIRQRLSTPNLDVFDAAYLLLALGSVGTAWDADEIIQYTSTRPDSEEGIQLAAVAGLRQLGAPSSLAEPFLQGTLKSSQNALQWVVEVEPAGAVARMRTAMGNGTGGIFERFGQQLTLRENDLDFLRGELSGRSARSAAAILAQVTRESEVAELLSSSAWEVRVGALTYAVANPQVTSEIFERLNAQFPNPVSPRLERDLKTRDMIGAELASVPDSARPWRAKLLRTTWRPQLSPALQMILTREEMKSTVAPYWVFRGELP